MNDNSTAAGSLMDQWNRYNTTTADEPPNINVEPKSTAPCPNCGYCPHCGRGGYYTYPQWPSYIPSYNPWWTPYPYQTWI